MEKLNVQEFSQDTKQLPVIRNRRHQTKEVAKEFIPSFVNQKSKRRYRNRKENGFVIIEIEI